MENVIQITLKGRDLSGGMFSRGTKGVNAMTSSVFRLKSALAGVGIGLFARSLHQATVDMEATRNSFKAITGSSAIAAGEIEFLRQESDRLGLSFQETASSYRKLAAAANQSSLQGQATKDIFIAVAEASTTLGLSAQDTEGSLFAITQMISKGKVSAEELRRQLGERLPGAFNIFARSIGVSTAELDKMLKNGEVMAEDALPKFAAELKKTFSPGLADAVNSTRAATNRLATAFFNLKVTLADSGLINGMTNVMKFMTGAMKAGGELVSVLPKISGGFTDVGDAVVYGGTVLQEFVLAGGRLIKWMTVTRAALSALGEKIAIGITTPFQVAIHLGGILIQTLSDVGRGIRQVLHEVARSGEVFKLLGQGDFGTAWLAAQFAIKQTETAIDDLASGVKSRGKEMRDAFKNIITASIDETRQTTEDFTEALIGAEVAFGNLQKTVRESKKEGGLLPTIPNGTSGGGGTGGGDESDPSGALQRLTSLQAAYLQTYKASFLELKTAFQDFSASFITGFSDGFGNAIATIATGTQKAGEAFKQLGLQMVGSLVKFGAQLVINTALAKALQGTAAVASIGTASLLASAWAGPAALVNAATFGAGANAGAISLLNIAAISKGIALAGQAHEGLTSVPRTGSYVLEEGERVVKRDQNADLTRALQGGGVGGARNIQVYVNGRPLFEVIEEASRSGELRIDRRSLIG